jgi:GMP synthase-like glutamine amidotransferase
MMIVYVHFEHKRLSGDPPMWRYFSTKALETKYRLEELSGRPCLIIRHDRLDLDVIKQLRVQAVVVGGNYSGFEHFSEKELKGLRRLFSQPLCPVLAICGSFQLMAETYGGKIGPIEPPASSENNGLRETDTPMPPDLSVSSGVASENPTNCERGFMPVRILRAHPLFHGLGQEPTVFQLHGGEVKCATDGFQVLAKSDLCEIQAIAHEKMPLVGTQFHPELYDETYPDGQKILENFLRMAGIAS